MDVSIADISNVIRLVREVGDRWDDPRAWREHLLHGACQLLDGNVGSMHALRFEENRHEVRTIAVVGLPVELTAKVYASTEELISGRGIEEVSNSAMPGFAKLYDDFCRQGSATASRNELTDEESFRASPMYIEFRQPLDCDDYVVSLRGVDVPQRAEIIGIDRPHGAEPFGQREVTLLKLLHDEIFPLVGVRLATEEHFSRGGLSRRLNETLNYLLDGRSEKQVADMLQLSPRTIHEYVTMLYKHFAVSSRAELLAYFIRRHPVSR